MKKKTASVRHTVLLYHHWFYLPDTDRKVVPSCPPPLLQRCLVRFGTELRHAITSVQNVHSTHTVLSFRKYFWAHTFKDCCIIVYILYICVAAGDRTGEAAQMGSLKNHQQRKRKRESRPVVRIGVFMVMFIFYFPRFCVHLPRKLRTVKWVSRRCRPRPPDR